MAPLTAPPMAQFRIVLISFLAAAIGLIAGLVAYVLYQLIGLFTNLFFFHRWSTNFRSVASHQLGGWVIVIPVIGGLIVGVMAKYGSSKIKVVGYLNRAAILAARMRRLQDEHLREPGWWGSGNIPRDYVGKPGSGKAESGTKRREV